MPPGSSRLLTLALLVGVTSVIAARLPTIQSEARANEQPAVRLPLHLGQWEGADVAVAADVQRALPTAHILSRQYHCPSGAADVTIVSGSDATVLHDPHDCLVGDGWHFLKEQSRWLDVGTLGRPIPVRDVLMVKGALRARMWYWYAIGSDAYTSTLPARLGLFRIRLTEGRGPRAQFARLIVAGETDSARTTSMLADLARQISASN